MNKLFRIHFVLGLFLAALPVFFACHLNGSTETEETFTFPSLKDSVKTADSVLIVLKAPNGQVIDTLFHDKLTSITSFSDLKAPHYTGGAVLIFIEATKDGKLVYKVERGFDSVKGGDLPETRVVYVTPSIGLHLDRNLAKVREGETVALPGYSVTPSDLHDKSVLWSSRNPLVFKIEGASLVALTTGTANLVCALTVDTTKKDSLSIEVVPRTEPIKPIDSLILGQDTLLLSLRGSPSRFTLRAIPTTASTDANWSLVSGTSIQLSPDGLLTPVAEGLSRVAAISKLDTSISDTAVVRVVKGRVVQIISPKDGAYVNSALITVTWNVDGQSQSNTQGLNLGPNTITRSAKDSAGADFTHSIAVYLDQTAPNPPSVKGSTTPVNTLTPRWSWLGGGNGGNGTFRLRLDDSNLSNSASTQDTVYVPTSNLDTGTHILYVQERDEAGNWSASGSASILIDIARPAPPTVSGPSVTNDSTPTWTWTTATAGTVQFRYRLDNPNLSTGTTMTTQKEFTPETNLTEGPHILYVQEGDAAGNWSNSGSRTINVDLTKPTAPRIDSTPYSPLNSLRPKFTWKSGTGGAKVYRARIDNTDLSSVAERTDSSLTPESDLQDGLRTLYVQERDSAGNWSATASRKIFLSPQKVFTVASTTSAGNSIAIRSDGVPFVVFSNPASSYEFKLYRYSNESWQFTGSPSLTSNQPPFMVADSKGNLLIGQRNNDSGSRPVVVKYDGSSWLDVGGSVFDTNAVESFTLTTNASDALFAAYVINSSMVSAKRYNGSSWLPMTTHNDIFVNSWYHSLSPALSATGTPYLAVMTLSKLTVRRYSGADWVVLGSEGFAGGSPREVSLGLTKSDEPVVAIADNDFEDKLVVRKFDGDQWTSLGGATASSGVASQICLKVTNSGNIMVAYLDKYLGSTNLRVQVLQGNQWVMMGSPVNVEDGSYLSLAIDGNGVPFVSFYDPSGGGSVKVLRTSFN